MKHIIICILTMIGLIIGFVLSFNGSEIMWSEKGSMKLYIIGISILTLSIFGWRYLTNRIQNPADKDL